jgi:hypothetical protein
MAHSKTNLPPNSSEKPCAHCAKPMVWRKAWKAVWDDVKYCSTACQRQANREARRTAPVVAEDDDAPPPLKTQRFNRPRKVRALPKGS